MFSVLVAVSFALQVVLIGVGLIGSLIPAEQTQSEFESEFQIDPQMEASIQSMVFTGAIFTAVASLVVHAILFVFFLFIAELIRVIQDIQDNTHRCSFSH